MTNPVELLEAFAQETPGLKVGQRAYLLNLAGMLARPEVLAGLLFEAVSPKGDNPCETCQIDRLICGDLCQGKRRS